MLRGMIYLPLYIYVEPAASGGGGKKKETSLFSLQNALPACMELTKSVIFT
jgi:hypothetical protein